MLNNNLLNVFQFHYGTIIRVEWLKKQGISEDISIPLWYDYKRIRNSNRSRFCNISIPLWYDYKGCLLLTTVAVAKFQFHYGTIIRLYHVIEILYNSQISIPLWYDYKKGLL